VITHSSGEVNTNTKFGSDIRGFVFGRAGYVVESGVLDWPKEQRRQQEILGWQASSTQSKSSGSWGAGIIHILARMNVLNNVQNGVVNGLVQSLIQSAPNTFYYFAPDPFLPQNRDP
jgi:hypothetical protein